MDDVFDFDRAMAVGKLDVDISRKDKDAYSEIGSYLLVKLI